MVKVSLIMTVYNEADNIEVVLRSLFGQFWRPSEIVIVDGGSTDQTVQRIEEFAAQRSQVGLDCPINLIVQAGANISQGRNLAIEAARYDTIAVTDAGVRLPLDWLEQLILPFEEGDIKVVAGFFRGDPNADSAFEIAMSATVLPTVSEINPASFLPSSRSIAFSKSAWQAVGGYPEWLDYCEDLIFDLKLKKAGYEFGWQPRAVAWFAPRKSLGAFYRQYYLYARGDGKAGLFLRRHLLRYFIYLVFAPLGIFLGWRKPLLGLGLIISGLGYIWRPIWRLFQCFPEFKELPIIDKIVALAMVLVIRATGDVAKMAGYPVGVLWRLRKGKLT